MSVKPDRPPPQERTMTVSLVTFGKGGVRKDFPIKKMSTVIGRKLDADLRIPLADISRAHCELTLDGDEIVVRDLDSSNGTFVNGEKVTEATLQAGDKLKVGPVTFIVQIDGQPRDVSPAMLAPRPPAKPASKPAAPASPSAETALRKPDAEDEDLDIDALSDSELDELSDLDIDDIDAELDEADLEDLDDLEELSDEDVLDDEDKK